jgi:hypothetical protein
MTKAILYRRPKAEFVFEGSVNEVIDRFNKVDPFERDRHFVRFRDRIFHAEEIDDIQIEKVSSSD